jgi:hypothetical protein
MLEEEYLNVARDLGGVISGRLIRGLVATSRRLKPSNQVLQPDVLSFRGSLTSRECSALNAIIKDVLR